MKIFWSEKIDEILKSSHPLMGIGVNNWALTRHEALIAIDKLMTLGVPILGGDVFEQTNDVLRHNYDNWYCNKLDNESIKDFIIKSHEKAKEYIESYHSNKPESIFFVIVPGRS
jgi:hypothetical protein